MEDGGRLTGNCFITRVIDRSEISTVNAPFRSDQQQQLADYSQRHQRTKQIQDGGIETASINTSRLIASVEEIPTNAPVFSELPEPNEPKPTFL
jgi:hypothetical protein